MIQTGPWIRRGIQYVAAGPMSFGPPGPQQTMPTASVREGGDHRTAMSFAVRNTDMGDTG